MKKYLLFALMLFTTLSMRAQMDASSALPFDWETGIQITEAGTYLYKVTLDEVPSGDNIILYLNNPSNESIDVKVQAYSLKSNGVSLSALSDEEVKTIAPNRKYALELSSALFRAFDAVYVRITVDKPIGFEAEPVEPGEKDLDCLNAPLFNWASTSLAANKETWYRVDLTEAVEDKTKTVEISMKNNSSETATVVAGVSFDCPSTGTTNRTITIPAGETKTTKIARSYFQMLPSDNSLYLQAKSDVAIRLSAKLVDADASATVTVSNPIDVVEGQDFTNNGANWYRVKVADFNQKGQLPEVTLENLASSAVTVKGEVVYSLSGEEPMTRTTTLGKGGVLVKEIKRNIIETAAEKGEYVYIRLTTNQDVRFAVRMKARTEGDACKSAKEFDWSGELQAANTELWYAIDITTAKATAGKDIQVKIQNKQSAQAVVAAEIAFDCPYTSTQSKTTKIGANKEVTQRLVRSTFASLSVNTIYVKVNTDRNILLSAELIDAEDFNDASCVNNYIDFDFDEGHVQAEGAQWYRVNIDQFNQLDKVPEVTIANRTSEKATVKVELAFDCPVTEAMQTRTVTIAGNGKYVNTPTSDMLKNIDADITYAFIRVTTDKSISITTELKYENEGEKCSTAVPFNWTVGHDQKTDSVWYAVDITNVKAQEKAIRLRVDNKDTEDVKVTVEVYFDCDSKTPQVASATVGAGSYKEKEIASGIIASNSANVIYIKVKSERFIHIQATLFDDDKVNICDYNFVEFDWENGHTQQAGTVWYKAGLASLRGTELTPQITLRNNESSKATVKAEVTFNCANAATTDKTQTLSSKQELVKMVERSTVDQYVQNDTVYFSITTDKEVYFRVDLVDPNQGQDCGHAVNFDWENGHIQEAGDVVWYKIDLSQIKGQDKAVRMHLDNLDGFSGKVNATLYSDCDTEAIESRSYTLGANAQKSTEISADVFNGFGSVMYVRLETFQQDKFYAEVYDDTTPKENDCEDAKQLLLNIDIAQEAGAQWYVLDLQDIRNNTTGDATLHIAAQGADNKIIGEVAFSCPAPVDRQSRTLNLKAGEKYDKVIERSKLDATSADKAYIKITTEQAISFRIDVEDHRGETCDNPIIFDWVNGNIHAGDGVARWYEVRLDTMTLDANKEADLRVNVENLTAEALAASALIKGDCAEEALFPEHDYSMAANGKKSKDISRELIESMTNFTPIRIRLTADKQVHLTAELVMLDREVRQATVADTVCPGTPLFDLYGNPLAVLNEGEHFLKVDTVAFTYDETLEGDSIITYEYWSKVSPVMPTAVAGISLVQGEAIDLSAATADVESQLAASKTDLTMAIDTIYWQVQNEASGLFEDLPATVAADATDMLLRLVVGAECDKVQNLDTLVAVTAAPVTEKDTVRLTTDVKFVGCAGYSYQTRLQNLSSVVEHLVFADTVRVAEDETTVTDSIYNYDLNVFVAPEKIDVTVKPVVECGAVITTTAAEKALLDAFESAATETTASVESIKFEQKDENGEWTDVQTSELTPADTEVTFRYVVTLECEDMDDVYGDEFTVTVANTCKHDELEQSFTVCANEEFETTQGPVLVTEDSDLTYNVSYVDATGHRSDSVYTYHFTVFTPLALSIADVDIDTIEAQCGDAGLRNLDVLDAEVRSKLKAQETDATVKLQDVEWQIEYDGAYTKLSDQLMHANTTYNVRFVVKTSCEANNFTSKAFRVSVDPRHTDDAQTGALDIIHEKYGWLLVINRAGLDSTISTFSKVPLEEEDILWYKVVGEPDPFDAYTGLLLGAADDELVGTGFYYTKNEALDADYYAIITRVENSEDECGNTLRSKIWTLGTAKAAPRLTPTYPALGEDVTISGLNPAEHYVVSVYDVAGKQVESHDVQGVDRFVMKAQDNAGYYMVNVQSADVKATLKYITK